MRWWTKRAIAVAAAFLLAAGAVRAEGADVTVFAAASLKNALDAVMAEHRRSSGKRVVASYAASSALARQVEQGAPADLIISADLEWMDYLQQRNLIRPETRRSLLGNRIVLVAPADRAAPVELKPGVLAAALRGGRLAIASAASVPAGRYAKAALENLGLWPELSGRLAEAENVRAALTFVSRGEAPLGIVYETDARADPNVAVVARFPDGSHPPIVYPVAVTAASKSPGAEAFLDALRSRSSAAIFAREGFTVLD
jgi:molybdate transport system substrate-binding protein